MSDEATTGGIPPTADPRYGDRAVAILRELETHRTDEPEIGPIASRIVARTFDIFLVAMVIWAVLWLADLAWFVVVTQNSNDYASRYTNPNPPDVPLWVEVLAALGVLVVLVAYEVLATRFFEATVGKRMMGLRIVKPDGRTGLSWIAITLRSLLWAGTFMIFMAVPFGPPVARVTFLGILALIVIAAHDRLNRAAHDFAAGSRVVQPR